MLTAHPNGMTLEPKHHSTVSICFMGIQCRAKISTSFFFLPQICLLHGQILFTMEVTFTTVEICIFTDNSYACIPLSKMAAKLLSLYMSLRIFYLWSSLCTLYLLACQVRVPVGDTGLCSYLQTPLSADCCHSNSHFSNHNMPFHMRLFSCKTECLLVQDHREVSGF